MKCETLPFAITFANSSFRLGVPVKCETKQKRNGTIRNRSKRTKQIETKRTETKRNKSKRNETNNMVSHCGQKSLFSNIRNSFLILERHSFILGNSFSNIRKWIFNIRNTFYFLILENYFIILENDFIILENEFLILDNNRYFKYEKSNSWY